MINKIWFWLLVIGIVVGAGKGIYYAARGQFPPNIVAAQAQATEAAPARPYSPDCNTNGIPDTEDIARGRSQDCNADLIPDECQNDCNANGAPDDCDIAAGTSADANSNGVPDDCEQKARPAEIIRQAGAHLTSEALSATKVAVQLCITLVGVMALWLGLMNIAKDAGLVDALARALSPAMRWLFPDVPNGHPAQGAMLMNLSANMLGMGNAATPFGLKAMEELEALNKTPGTCTNAMAMFLAINTSSVTIIPITLIGIRIGAGSTNAAGPMAGLLMATTISTITAIFVTKALAKLPRYALPNHPGEVPGEAMNEEGGQ